MAILSVKETHDGNDGEQTLDGGLRITRIFYVRTTANSDGPYTVINAAGLPGIGDSYTNGTESASGIILKRIRPKRHRDQPLLWTVECEYEEQVIDGEGAEAGAPEARPTKYTWSTIQEPNDIEVDTTGQKTQNSAGDVFLSGVQVDKSAASLTIERNESSFDRPAMEAYINTLNSTPIFGYAAKEGRMISIDATGEYDAIYGGFWTVTYTIHFRLSSIWVPSITAAQLLPASVSPGPWDVTRRNVGTRARPAAGEEPINAVDAHGHQETEGVDLIADGTRKATAAAPFYYVFKPYAAANWSPLSL